jgi:hypothetical protein
MTARKETWETHLRKNWKRLAKYPEELTRPLPPMSLEDWRDPLKAAQRNAELARRAAHVAEHFGIPSGDPYDLLTALLYVHVPGFRETKALSGPKIAWTEWTRAELLVVFEVEGQRDRYAKEPEIAAKLAERQDWKTRFRRAENLEGRKRALLAQLRAARKRRSKPEFLRMYQYARTAEECRRKYSNWEWTDSRISIEQFENTARELGFDLNLKLETGNAWFPEFKQRIRAIEQTRT